MSRIKSSIGFGVIVWAASLAMSLVLDTNVSVVVASAILFYIFA